jgi:hypothetical protein
MSGISPAASLLNSYDPTNPSSIDSSLTGAGLSDSYYAQGLNGTGSYDPGTQGPTAAVPVAATTTPASVSSGPNVYQQALSSLQEWSDQTLIVSALGGGSTTSSPNDDSSSVVSGLEAAAEAQQATQAAQQQSALAAAQAALNAGTNVDTTA